MNRFPVLNIRLKAENRFLFLLSMPNKAFFSLTAILRHSLKKSDRLLSSL